MWYRTIVYGKKPLSTGRRACDGWHSVVSTGGRSRGLCQPRACRRRARAAVATNFLLCLHACLSHAEAALSGRVSQHGCVSHAGASPWRSVRLAVATFPTVSSRALSLEGRGGPRACVSLHESLVAAVELGVV